MLAGRVGKKLFLESAKETKKQIKHLKIKMQNTHSYNSWINVDDYLRIMLVLSMSDQLNAAS